MSSHAAPQTSSGGWFETLVAAAATAVVVTALTYFPERNDGSGAVVGGISALIAAAFALPALATYRSLPARSAVDHTKLAALAVGAGIGFGVANLGINYGMAALDTNIYEQMVTRWAEFSAWSVVVSGPIIEEIAFRLVLLSGLAWIVARFTDDRPTIFYVAWGVSAALFGLAHIFYGGVEHPMHKVGMAVKSSAAGLLLGWIFWRWGLPYSALCHCAANGIHLLLEPFLF